VENLAPPGIRSPDRPAHSQSLYQLSYPAHKFSNKFEQNTENANIFSVTSNSAREVHYSIFQCIEAGLIWHCMVFTTGISRKAYELKLVSLNFVLILSPSSVGATARGGALACRTVPLDLSLSITNSLHLLTSNT
jgi:hypothetical protein